LEREDREKKKDNLLRDKSGHRESGRAHKPPHQEEPPPIKKREQDTRLLLAEEAKAMKNVMILFFSFKPSCCGTR
jgi:hypothetical protein